MKNLKTHILERLKISPNINAQFTEQLDELLSGLGLDTVENAHDMFDLSSYEDYIKAKNHIIFYFWRTQKCQLKSDSKESVLRKLLFTE